MGDILTKRPIAHIILLLLRVISQLIQVREMLQHSFLPKETLSSASRERSGATSCTDPAHHHSLVPPQPPTSSSSWPPVLTWDVPVIMFLMKSLWPGASMMVM